MSSAPDSPRPRLAETLTRDLADARARTLALVSDLRDDQLLGPRLAIVNPLRWEIGHAAWFQERWLFRRQGEPSIRPDADALWDSFKVPHDSRWDLPLPPRAETLAYMDAVLERALERLRSVEPSALDAYFYRLVIHHEDMHAEAFTYTRQTLGYPAPSPVEKPAGGPPGSDPAGIRASPVHGDAEVPGGRFLLGATRDIPFVFDNEKWGHPVRLGPFRIARAAVTQEEFAEFVEADGYSRREHWSGPGWEWRTRERAEAPLYWRRAPGGGWERRHFDRWVPLEPDLAVIHVCWHEAEAYCRWAGRRLPTEAEWEAAASAVPEPGAGGLGVRKRRYPWGDDFPAPDRARLDSRGVGCVTVGAHPAGDSATGCRQMLGNVWEWTSSVFAPYPGYEVDPYKEYSKPWFDGGYRVLRGGCWATRSRLIRNTWRNFYAPDRRDVFAGFRTCAL